MSEFTGYCSRCGEELRFDVQSSARYCSVRCRVAAFRDRRRADDDTTAWLAGKQRRATQPVAADHLTDIMAIYESTIPTGPPPAGSVYFDFFDLDPEPWPGFNGSTGVRLTALNMDR
jgi:hypothetical protein